MSNQPKVSVILPYYNAEERLAKSIESILNQSFTDFELLCVNNNSTDDSRKIAEKFAKKDKRIKLLEENKQGVAHASETGLKASQANFIARTDADDICREDRLEKQYHFLRENPTYQAVGSQVSYSGAEGNDGMQYFIDKTNKRISHKSVFLYQFSELQIINPTLFFRKETAEKYGYYKHGDFPEDYEMFLRWLSRGVKFYKIPEKLLQWHDSPGRLTRTDSRYAFKAFYETKSPYIAEYSRKHNPHHPKVAIWGAGRRSRRRANILKEHGLEIDFYIDIKQTKDYAKYYKEVTKAGDFFILVYVAKRNADEFISAYLESKGFVNGKDFLIVA
jgi:glycosyltransferase involved in cell wall biosynthesis